MRRIEHTLEASLGQVLSESGDEQINQLIQKNADLFSANREPNGFCLDSPIHIKTNHPPITTFIPRERPNVKHAIAGYLRLPRPTSASALMRVLHWLRC